MTRRCRWPLAFSRWPVARLGVTLAVALSAGCATRPPPVPPPANVTPRFPGYMTPDVPAGLSAAPAIRDQHLVGWRRLQAGDLRGAEREFTAVLKRSPAFYPAETGLGYARLADRDFRRATARFSAALQHDADYLPALVGLADAQLEEGDDLGAIETMERILRVDPARESVRTRLELLKFRQVQALIESGRRAREANRLEESQSLLERALKMSPQSAVILRELSLVELRRGAHDTAEEHARRATQLDPFDALTHAALGEVLEARGRFVDAAESFARAAAIDTSYRGRVERLREKVEEAAVPPEFRDLPAAISVTRAQLAAVIGMRLGRLIDQAPKRAPVVATDVRGNWAAPWIVRVTQAGVMEISPNHTFQPAATVRRGDLARVVTQLLALAAAGRPDFAKWQTARPRFTDLPPSNLFYRPAALAVAAGAMAMVDGDRFQAIRPATGAEVMAAMARIEQIASR